MGDRPEVRDPDLADWLRQLATERGASTHTVRAYRTDLEGLVEHLAASEKSLLQAERGDLRAWLGRDQRRGEHQSQAPLAPATRARRIAAVRHFYAWLVREGRLETSPAARLSTPKVPRRVPMVLDVHEATTVVEQPGKSGWLLLRNQALLELVYGAGLRVGEAVAVNVEHIDLQERLVRVLGKGDKERIVPFGPPASRALGRWFAAAKLVEGAVFLNRSGGRLSARSAWTIVQQAGAKHGLSGLHPHALRHSCATHMLRNAADLRAIQEQLGHASLSTTQRYTQIDAAHLMDVYAKAHPTARRKGRRDNEE